MRYLFLLAAIWPLSACWSGLPFYTAADAAPAIAEGVYRMSEAGSDMADGDRITIRQRADKSLSIEGGDHPMQALTIPLGSDYPGRFIVQLQKIDPASADRAPKAMYLLLDNRDDKMLISILPCDAETGAIVRAHGGSVARDPQSAASCTFPSRALLHRQMLAVAAEPMDDQIELTKVTP
ncbi:hypothetical protein [Sphingobium sp.]|uniref:hypothetical protein n=1 Tax=Sphingobium sp. TaxID=1912891 RepID=UPI003B3A8E06